MLGWSGVGTSRFYYFKASDIGKALDLSNIRTSIVNFDEDERTVRTTYSSSGGNPDTLFLTSQYYFGIFYLISFFILVRLVFNIKYLKIS